VDGTYILELYKDEKKGEAKATIVMDFCTEVVCVSPHLCFLLLISELGDLLEFCPHHLPYPTLIR
jgi:hypothetical protein